MVAPNFGQLFVRIEPRMGIVCEPGIL
jgi:hypothetical protein